MFSDTPCWYYNSRRALLSIGRVIGGTVGGIQNASKPDKGIQTQEARCPKIDENLSFTSYDVTLVLCRDPPQNCYYISKIRFRHGAGWTFHPKWNRCAGGSNRNPFGMGLAEVKKCPAFLRVGQSVSGGMTHHVGVQSLLVYIVETS
jgi:hypothetical protein